MYSTGPEASIGRPPFWAPPHVRSSYLFIRLSKLPGEGTACPALSKQRSACLVFVAAQEVVKRARIVFLLHQAVEVVKAHTLPRLAGFVTMLQHRRDLLVGHRL